VPGALPLAPRPYPGEALSCWVARVASRYGATADDLCRHLLGGQGPGLDRVERLDHRADPELVGLLAAAARIAPDRLRALRVTLDDGIATCWHRTTATWCPDCVSADLAHGPEVYDRAIWRLGCFVVCPDHGVLLQNACRQCWREAPCHFRHARGRMTLACSSCNRLPYLSYRRADDWKVCHTGAFLVQVSPELATLVSELQHDLQAALSGVAPHRSWGFVQSGSILLMVVRHMAFSIVLTARIRFAWRIELVPARNTIPTVPALHEPMTPAVLSPRIAFGALAIIAAVLDSLEARGGSGHKWKRNGVPSVMDATSFVAWLSDDGREWLQTVSRHWDHAVSAAF
jgi:TniQ